MYLGKGWFTHASTITHEVVYSNLFTSAFYKKRLRVCRRYLPDAHKKVVATPPPVTLWKTKELPMPISTVVLKNKVPEETTLKKAIVIKAPLQTLERSSSHGNYYVQVGSFIGKPKSALIDQITRSGFTYKVIRFSKDKKEISKLLIGPYTTRNATLPVLNKVKQKIQKDAFIAEIR